MEASKLTVSKPIARVAPESAPTSLEQPDGWISFIADEAEGMNNAVSDFVRKNPATTLLAAVAVGFLGRLAISKLAAGKTRHE